MNYSIKSSESVTEHTNEDEHGYNKKNKILTAFIHSCLYVCETVSVYNNEEHACPCGRWKYTVYY